MVVPMRSWMLIVACAGFCLALIGLPGNAEAKPISVSIKSKPAGATVWIDDRAGEPAGTTPLNIRLETGKHTVYVELDGYEALTKEITVRRRKKRFNFRLDELETGSILVLSGADGIADDATVLIDGEEVGTVPDSFDVPEGSHDLEVRKEGYESFKQILDIGKGSSTEVTVELVKATSKPAPDRIQVEEKPSQSETPLVPTEPNPVSPFSIGVSIGTAVRDYVYRDAAADNPLRPFESPQLGIGMVEVTAELRLGGLSSAKALRPFSIFASASTNVPTKSTREGGVNDDVATRWIRREVGLRTRLSFGSTWLAIDLAESGDSLDFSDTGNMELDDNLPKLSYELVRLGLLFGFESGGNSLGIGADGLWAFSVGGVVEREFADDRVLGFRGHAWYQRHIAFDLYATIAVRYGRLFHSFESGAQVRAESATDRTYEGLANLSYQF